MGQVRAHPGRLRAGSSRRPLGRSALATALLSAAEIGAIAWAVAWVVEAESRHGPARSDAMQPLLVVGIVVTVVVATRLVVGGLLARTNGSAAQRIARARRSQDRLSSALVEAVDSAKEHERARARLTHDARNACAGVRASLELLEHHQAELDAEAKAKLRKIALSGLAHLEEVIVQNDPDARDFTVTEVVTQIVSGRCLLGARVAVLGGDVLAHGRPHQFATALLNLLVNAERHAPGTLVTVDVAQRGDQVRVCVRDGGPGVAAGHEEVIFDRGWHASGSPGQGLGLHTARELMRGQGGDVRLVPGTDGAAFVLTLPAAACGPRPAVRSAGAVGAVAGPRSALTTAG